MKELEDALKQIPKPALQVDRFKQNLRRELLSRAPNQGSYRLGFLLSSAAAGFALFFLVLFVIKPEFPERLNRAILGTPASSQEWVATQPPTRVKDSPDAFVDVLGQPINNELFEEWYSREFPSEYPFEIKSVGTEKVFAIKRIELKGGKHLVVYTEIDQDQASF